MLEYILIGGLIIALLFSLYMGVFSKLTIDERPFPGGYFIYYDYQGHINSVALFHKNLQKSLGIDTSKLPRMTITYDDPFNLKDARSFRTSIGFLVKEYDPKLIESFKKLHYEWRMLPQVQSLSGELPYRNAASLTFGMSRFLPTCLTYIYRNARKLKGAVQNLSSTIEVVDGGMIRYYLIIEKPKEFYLTSHE